MTKWIKSDLRVAALLLSGLCSMSCAAPVDGHMASQEESGDAGTDKIAHTDGALVQTNVALGKPAQQSSVRHNGVASRAVDGDTRGAYADGSVTHTESSKAPWWQVDLKAAHRVDRVTIWNRTDCCSERLSDFHVDYLGADGRIITSANYSGTAGATAQIALSGQKVHAVRVQLNGTRPLSLAEVQVWGAPDDDVCADCTTKFNSYKGLVMAGYQGWFNAPNDGAEQGFRHYQKDGKFEPGSCTIDFWPDMTEYPVKHKTSFQFADGSPAYVFSSYDASAVDLHFKWMSQYGIDGAFMQRFTHSITKPNMNRHYMKVFDSAIRAAKKYNRAISIRYDITDTNVGDWQDLLDDLDTLDAKYDFHGRSEFPTFLHHRGKPLIAIGGVGWQNDIAGGGTVRGLLDEAERIVDGLRARGYSILVRVPHSWQRGGSSQMLSNERDRERFEKLLKKTDIVMPWHVAAFRQETYESGRWHDTLAADMAWCRANNLDYVPVLFPGFSWYNMKGSADSFRPRNGGAFFWLQAYWAVEKGAEMFFLAQFDEMDEGTQLFKVAHKVPVGASRFQTYEADVRSDHYLWLAGKSAEMLRGDIPTTKGMPRRP